MSRPLVFALTGRSGSGKSAVSAAFAARGIPVLDCDEAARRAVDLPGCRDALCRRFGWDLYPGGALDRPLLAARAFADKESTAALTAITHPFIIRLLLEQIERAGERGSRCVVVDGSTIIDGPFAPYCDKIMVVESSDPLRISRILKRDGITEQAAQARLAAQPSDEVFRAAADWVIQNKGTLAQLEDEIQQALQTLERWADEAGSKKTEH